MIFVNTSVLKKAKRWQDKAQEGYERLQKKIVKRL
jgi:hypothetical protein